jgi:hypothetical protein
MIINVYLIFYALLIYNIPSIIIKMSERSGSPCSDRNNPTKKKKIYKIKYE